MYERYIELSWLILEHKCKYYKSIGPKPIPDAEYDLLEEEYRRLSKELGKNASACDMVGFDEDRPSCKLVMSKFLNKNGVK